MPYTPPVGMPSVFDEAFKGSGEKAGVEIWRIEKLTVVKKQPGKNGKDEGDPYKGQLHEGDCYIVLNTKDRNGALQRDIHFWIGKESSQDEYGCAAYKTVELDQMLGDEPVQYRETQGNESDKFSAIFKHGGGLKYFPGGVATGFKHVDRDAFETKLFHVKGKRNIKVFPVELNQMSMNQDDVFILDAGPQIFQWNGKNANKYEKMKGLQVTQSIKDNERGGKAEVFIVEQGGDEGAFWKAFGLDKPALINRPAKVSDEEFAKKMASTLYQVSDSTGSIKVTEVAKSPLKQDMLKTEDCFIIDQAGKALYAWIGKGATEQEKLHAWTTVDKFIKDKGYPHTIPAQRVVENAESPQFKENFSGWVNKGQGEKQARKKFVKKEFDIQAMNKQQREAQSLVDDGSGKVEIWRIEDMEKVPYPKDLYGQFFGGDSYIILYTYTRKGSNKEEYIIYFWQGHKSSQDERGASAILTKDLDDSMGGAPVQCRVVQNKEPPHFYLLFKGKMVVHAGGKASGFKNRNDVDSYDTDGTRLFQIKGTSAENTRAVQVEEVAASLNSGDSFLLESPKGVWLWKGKFSSTEEYGFAKSIAATVVPKREVKNITEGTESAAFWEALGGKTPYAEASEVEEFHEPRLFHCSNANGYFTADEVFEFDQQDLEADDVFLLDTHNEIFVWVGEAANREEKEQSMKTALEFVKVTNRDVDATPVYVIKQGQEPPNFTANFIGWDPEVFNSLTYEQLKAKVGTTSFTTSAAEELAKYAGGQTFPYETLVKHDGLPDVVDPSKKEQYLSDDDFKKHLGMDKLEYSKLPAWKAAKLKKKAQLF